MDEKLKEIEEEARSEHIPVMLSDTAMFLANWCCCNKPSKILEIGTAVGYSGNIMLLNSGDNSILTTIEKDEKSFQKARENFKAFNIEPRVLGYLGDAKDILPWLEDEYDLIFLDGPKGQYINYLPTLLKLLKIGGTLIADNVYYKGMVLGETETPRRKKTIVKNLQKFNEAVSNDKCLETVFHKIGDGVCEIKKLK
ncbi:MAG: O-methyltransferase [Clostridia bacterium]